MTSAVTVDGLDEQEVLERFFDALAAVTRADAITMWRFDEATGRFFGGAERGLRHRPEFLASPPRPDRIAGRIARSRQPGTNHAGGAAATVTGPFVFREAIESFIGIPLMKDGQVYAVLFLSYRQHRDFDEAETERLVRVANGLAGEHALDALDRTAPPVVRPKDPFDRRLNFIVDQGCTITNAPVALWAIDRLKGSARIRSATGLSASYREQAHASLSDMNHVVSKVAAGEEAEICDVGQASDSEMAAEWRTHRWCSILGVPVRAGRDVLAVLTVSPMQNRSLRSWEEIPVLRDLAQEIGEVLVEERRGRTISRLNALDLSFVQSPRLPHVLKSVLEQAADLFEAQHATLYPYDVDCTMCRHPVGPPTDPRTHDARSGLALKMVRDRIQSLASDDEKPPAELGPTLRRTDPSSWVAVNLSADGPTEAILFLDFEAPHAFFHPQRDLLSLFGTRAAHAIRAAQAFEAGQRRNTVASAAENFASTDSEEAVISALKVAVSKVLGGPRVESFAAITLAPPSGTPSADAVAPARDLLLAAARATQAPQIWQEDPAKPGHPLAAAAGRYMTLPFGLGEIRGALGVEAMKTEAHYHRADLELVMELVQHASAALERVHYAQLQSRLLPAVSEVNGAVAQLLLLDQNCRELLDQVVVKLDADVASVQLVNPELNTIEAIHGLNAPWTGEAVHSLTSGDIQADVLRTRKTEFIEGLDPRFDKELYEKYEHEKLARFFAPIFHAGRPLGTLEVGWDRSKRPGEQRPASVEAARGALGQILRAHTQKLWRSTFQHTVEVILSKAVEMTGADSGTIHVMPKVGGYVYESQAGRIGPEFILAYPPGSNGIGTTARHSRTLQYIDDPAKLADSHKHIFEVRELAAKYPDRYQPGQGVRAIACFWFASEDRYGGMLYIHFWRPHRFSAEELRLLEHFRDQLSKAILNANIHARLRDNSRALASIGLIRESAAGGFHLGTLLGKIAGSARRALNANIVTIYTYDEETETFAVPPTIGGAEELRQPERMRTAVGEGDVPWQLIKRGENVYEPNAAANPVLHDRVRAREGGRLDTFVDREGIVSTAAVILTAGTERVGVMFVNYRDPRPFTDGEKRLIENFAFFAALAVRNARTATQMMLEQMRAVGAIDLSVAPTLEPNRVFDLIVKKTVDNLVLDDGYATLQLCDDEKDELSIRACSGIPPDKRDVRISKNDPTSVTALVARTGRLFRIPDIENNRSGFYRELVPGMRSELAVPLMRAGRAIGVLNVESRRREAFHETEEEFLTLLAKQAVTAIRNAEFTTRLQEGWQTLTAMRSPGELPDILQTIAKTVIGMAAVEWALIAPYGAGTDQVARSRIVFARDRSSGVELDGLLDAGLLAQLGEQAARIAANPTSPRDVRPADADRPFTEICVPMRSAAPVGLLLAGHRGTDPLPEADLVVLQAFAEQAATAVLVAKTLEEQRQQGRLTVFGRRGIGFLHGVNRLVTAAHELLNQITSSFEEHDLSGVGELLANNEELIENLKKMESVGSKQRQKPVQQLVDVRRLARDAREMLGRVDPRIKIELPGHGPLLRVRGDPTDLKTAVFELLRNAVDVIDPEKMQGLVSVDVHRPDTDPGVVRISVVDNGHGMSFEETETCKLPLYTTKPGSHLGLGLYLVAMVAEDHGGRLDVESGIGFGSTFTIQLPAVQ